MNIKKLSVVALAAVMVFVFAGCGQKAEDEAAVTNPVHECSKEEMLEATGIDIAAPENAESAEYAYIEATDDAAAIAQVVFTLDGTEFCYRAQSTDITELGVEETEDFEEALNSQIEATETLSGMYEEWSEAATQLVADREAICVTSNGGAGYIAWLDVVPGFMYSLSVGDGATQDMLIQTANQIFVPMQGEV